MNEFVLYVDFDSTLYDAKRFGQDLFEVIAKQADVSSRNVAATVESFFTHPQLGGYDFVGHITSFGLDAKIMWRQLEELLAKNNYLYQDSSDFIRTVRHYGYRPKILSFGDERFQKLKILSVIPLLTGANSSSLDVIVIDHKKADYIRAHTPGQVGVLIDDVPNQKLPAGFTEINIDRRLKLSNPVKNKDGYQISTLAQAHHILAQLTKSF
ncbi:MAG TPA: HAD family hydrolase [Candidatus Saccharimonadales bacterium]